MYHMVIIEKQRTFISSGTNLLFGKDVLFQNCCPHAYQSVDGIVVSIVDSKSIFIEVLHMYIYDPVTIVRVSTPLHCCNII